MQCNAINNYQIQSNYYEFDDDNDGDHMAYGWKDGKVLPENDNIYLFENETMLLNYSEDAAHQTRQNNAHIKEIFLRILPNLNPDKGTTDPEHGCVKQAGYKRTSPHQRTKQLHPSGSDMHCC